MGQQVHRGLAAISTHSLRRVLRGAMIGLQLAGRSSANGPGSDRQLARKAIEAMREMARRGAGEDARSIMDDVAKVNATHEACWYDGCEQEWRREGLCLKHILALTRGDDEAKRAVRRYHKSIESIEKPETAGDRGQGTGGRVTAGPEDSETEGPEDRGTGGDSEETTAAGEDAPDQDKEQTMAQTYKCNECNIETATPHGLKIHKAKAHGQRKPALDASLPQDGSTPPGGHPCPHCGRRFGRLGNMYRHRAGCEKAPAGDKSAKVARMIEEKRRSLMLTIAADAPAAITARTRALAAALGLMEIPHVDGGEGIVLLNPGNGRLANVRFDGRIEPGELLFPAATGA